MTAKGKIVFTILILAALGFGIWRWKDKLLPQHGGSVPNAQSAQADSAAPTAAPLQTSEVVETLTETPKLPAAVPYQPKDNVVEVELSEYAGYAGFIAANGG